MLRTAATVFVLTANVAGVSAGYGPGVCKRGDYQNIGWGGMDRAGCLKRGKEVQGDSSQCAFLSYTASAVPVQQGNFCRCFKACDELETPEGQVWETVDPTDPTGASDTLPADDTAVSAGYGQGVCKRGDYQNIGWGGMDRAGCLKRAGEVQHDTSQCAFLSYTSSAQPVKQGNFCRCFKACDELETPEGQVWETMDPTTAPLSSGSLLAGPGWVVAAGLAGLFQ